MFYCVYVIYRKGLKKYFFPLSFSSMLVPVGLSLSDFEGFSPLLIIMPYKWMKCFIFFNHCYCSYKHKNVWDGLPVVVSQNRSSPMQEFKCKYVLFRRS